MKTIGCLVIIVLVGVGIFLLAGSQDMIHEQKAQWLGEKAHRGWNRAKKFLGAAREGWQSAEQEPSAGAPDR